MRSRWIYGPNTRHAKQARPKNQSPKDRRIQNKKSRGWDLERMQVHTTQLDIEADMRRRKHLTEQNKIHNKRQKAQTLILDPNPSVQCIYYWWFSVQQRDTEQQRASEIDIFYRNHLCHIVNLSSPDVISNENLYALTGEKVWTPNKRNRCLRFLGHILKHQRR